MKIKKKGEQVANDILLDNEIAYLTDYTAIQRVSLNKLVFTHGHSVSNVTVYLRRISVMISRTKRRNTVTLRPTSTIKINSSIPVAEF